MRQAQMSAAQKAAVEKIKILMREYAVIRQSSFLYNQEELLKNIEKDLTKLDDDYVKKHKIPADVVKKLAKEVYDALMEKSEFDKAIIVADHYKL